MIEEIDVYFVLNFLVFLAKKKGKRFENKYCVKNLPIKNFEMLKFQISLKILQYVIEIRVYTDRFQFNAIFFLERNTWTDFILSLNC